MIAALIIKGKVRAAIEAFNDRDLDTYLRNWTDDAVLVYPGDVPGVSGIHTGKAAIRTFYEHDLEQFPTLQLTLRAVCVANIFDVTGTNTAAAHWDAAATSRDGVQIQNSGVRVMTLKKGKATRVVMYLFDHGQKFRAAWGLAEDGR